MTNEITLTIIVNEQGCRVEGPINDKVTCYGILKLAEQAIYAFDPKANGGLVVPPSRLTLT